MADGTLKVFTFMPAYQPTPQGRWSVDNGITYNNSGAMLSLAAGPYTISFEVISGVPEPMPLAIVIEDDEVYVRGGAYQIGPSPESLLETGCEALKETKTYALDTIISTPFFFAASSMDASFSGYRGGQSSWGGQTIVPPLPPGEAAIAAATMGVVFGQVYSIMLEGGQEASDLISDAELDAIAAIVEPYLTTSGLALPGGIPIFVGYELVRRTPTYWVIQRGKGFSIQPAVDSGYVAGFPTNVCMSWVSIGSTPGNPKTVTGFAAAFNGVQTWPDEAPSPYIPPNPLGAIINGMPNFGLDVSSGGSSYWVHPIEGYPSNGGANISQSGQIDGSVSVHTVNGDGTINAVFVLSETASWVALSSIDNPRPPAPPNLYYPIATPDSLATTGMLIPLVSAASNTDWYSNILDPAILSGGVPNGNYSFFTDFPPKYYPGSPDWLWQQTDDFNNNSQWGMYWLRTNAQINTMPLVMIFWIGLDVAKVPQVQFTGPAVNPDDVGHLYGASPGQSFPLVFQEPLNDYNCMAPADRNARVTATTNGTVSPFNISLSNPQSASSWNLFNLQ